ncbi:MAG: hypothetical protein ABS61_00035 [Microbacterium sp. SCN 70-18]|nr:MAG: hypothetical protein ABS61_00035 [Microbacterium sp. SCN 70-18]
MTGRGEGGAAERDADERSMADHIAELEDEASPVTAYEPGVDPESARTSTAVGDGNIPMTDDEKPDEKDDA